MIDIIILLPYFAYNISNYLVNKCKQFEKLDSSVVEVSSPYSKCREKVSKWKQIFLSVEYIE